MRVNRRKNNIIIGGLCAILLIMIVGYAAFYSQLKISGTSKITSSWDVEITNIESKNIVGSASNKTEPTYTKLSATFNTNLVSPSDSITYDITVENKGSVDATLKTITKTDTSNSAILFKTYGLKEGGTLQVGKSAILTVKVTYDPSVTKQPDNLTSTLKVTLDFVQNNGDIVPISGKTTSDLITETVTTGDGLYVDDTVTGRYVYRGVNPDNYIQLGSDMYRIMAVEKDGTLKVIKNESIGNIPFDPSYFTSISGVTAAYSVTGTRYSNTSTDYCYQNSGAEDYYFGCKVWGSKTTMLDSSGNNITQMPREIGGAEYNLPEKEAYINTYLNSTWLNTLSTDVQSKIVTHIFNVGLVNYNEAVLSNTVTQESSYKWNGKVALMTASDYINSNTNIEQCGSYSLNNTNYTTCKTTNWINSLNSSTLWMILPYSDSSPSYAVLLTSSGYFGVQSITYDGTNWFLITDGEYSIAPVFFLSSNINLLGEGSEGSPYKLSTD